MSEGVERPRTTISFDVGEQVRVADGPFASFNGYVEKLMTIRRASKLRCHFGR